MLNWREAWLFFERSTGKYVINFDSNDLYKSYYFINYIFTLKDKNKKETGSSYKVIYNGEDFINRGVTIYICWMKGLCLYIEGGIKRPVCI